MKKNSIKHAVSPFTRQAVCTPETELGTAVDLVSNTYEPIFVFKKMGQNNMVKDFLGIVSLYDALISRSLPYTTKVISCLFMPTHLTEGDSLLMAANEMVARKIHTLPVFSPNKKNIIGVVMVKHLITTLISNGLFKKILPLIHSEKAHTAHMHSLIKDVRHMLYDKEVSEVVVVHNDGSVAGIATREDVAKALSKPTSRQRFTSRGDMASREKFFDREIHPRDYTSLDKYVRPTVCVERMKKSADELMAACLRDLIIADNTSVVIIDKLAKPTQILTHRNILEACAAAWPQHSIPILIHDQRKHYSAIEKDRILEILDRFTKKIDKRTPLYRLSISFEESKTQAQTIRSICVTLKLVLRSGSVMITHAENRDSLLAVRKCLKELQQEHEHRIGKMHAHIPSSLLSG